MILANVPLQKKHIAYWRELKMLLTPVRPILYPQAQALGATLCVALLSLLQPVLVKLMVDAVAAQRPVSVLLGFGGLFAIHQLVRAGAAMFARERNVYAGQRVMLQVRRKLYGHILRLCPVTLGGLSRGEALFRLTGDLRSVETFLSRVLVRAASVGIAFVGVFVALMLMDVRLAALAVAAVPIYLVLTRNGQRRLRQCAEDTQAGQARLTSLMAERLGALEAIHLARRERREARLAYRAGRNVFEAELRQIRAGAWLWGSIEGITGLTAAGVLTVGAIAVTDGALSLGSLLAFYMYVEQLFAATTMGTEVASSAVESMAGVRRAAAVLRLENPIRSGPKGLLPKDSTGSLHAESITFAYPGRMPVLNGLNFSVKSGEHLAITGPSGCGKSTFVRLFVRLLDPQHGRILLDGCDIRQMDLHVLRGVVALVPQTPGIIQGTLDENIAFGSGPPRITVAEAARRACLDPDLLAHLQDREVGEGGSKLSGGQRQRLLIARLLMEDPKIIILDEPTSSVDPQTEFEIWKSIREVFHDRTLIAITHNWAVAAKFPRVLVMDQGQLVRDGPPSEADGVASLGETFPVRIVGPSAFSR